MIVQQLKLICLVGAVTLTACGEPDKVEATPPPAIVENAKPEAAIATLILLPDAVARLGIETVAVNRRDVHQVRIFAGEVTPAPGANSPVTAPFAGVVAAPKTGLPNPGVLLERGAVVISLRPVATQTAGVSPAEDLRVKKLELDNARARLKRTSELLAVQGASAEELEQAKADVARAEAMYNGVNAQLGGHSMAANSNESSVAIIAPLDGVLAELNVGPGQMVNVGDPLFRVLARSPALVRVPLFPSDAEGIARDATAMLGKLGARADSNIAARRIEGALTATPLAASIDLYFKFDDPDGRFRPGERVEVAIPYGAKSTRSVVPLGCVFTDIHGGTWIYKNLAEGVYSRRRVVVDYLLDDLVVLASGPPADTRVVSVGVAELAGSEFGVGK